MESLRAGRTRYLVVVSRPASKKAQQVSITTATTTTVTVNRMCASPNRNNNQLPLTTTKSTEMITSQLNINSSSSSTDEFINQERRRNSNCSDDNNRCSISTSYQSTSNQAMCSDYSHFSANMTTEMAASTCDNEYSMCKNLAQCSQLDDHQQCDNESTVGSSCSSKSSSNELEESCLLGIDCNEKTTVGLVLKVLADTAIRLDGDG